MPPMLLAESRTRLSRLAVPVGRFRLTVCPALTLNWLKLLKALTPLTVPVSTVTLAVPPPVTVVAVRPSVTMPWACASTGVSSTMPPAPSPQAIHPMAFNVAQRRRIARY